MRWRQAVPIGVTLLLAVVAVGLSPTAAQRQEAEVAWSEEFDSSDSPALGRIYYEDRGSGKSGEEVVIREVVDGVLRYGLKFDPERKQDRLNVMFGDCVWGPPRETGWGPFDAKQYPFVEMKWRGGEFTFYYGGETTDGRRLGTYAFPPVMRKETDEQGREWNISLFRLAPDSSVSTKGTAVKLIGINLALYSPGEEGMPTTEVDYIRVRGFTAEEAAREEKIIEALMDFPRGRWRGFEEFFPFGVYVGYLRSDFESWGGDYEGAYGNYVRHHLNFVASNDEVELGRFGQGEAAVESYITEMNKLIAAARATGIRLGADVRRMMEGRDPADGYRQLLPITRRLNEAFAEDDVIVSWKIADEPGVDRLIPLAMMMRALREADPHNRPQLIEFSAPVKMEPFASYLNLNCWDRYPIVQGSRNPWAIRDLAREHRQIASDMPMWAVLQSFETRPPTPKGSYMRPSDAEIRMMGYLALAEGAKGLLWYAGWSGYGRDEGLVTRTGQPRGGMLDALADLGRRLIPIGQLLLHTDPLDEAGVTIAEEVAPADDHSLAISVLKHRERPVSYLVVVNEDLSRERTGQVILGGLLGEGQEVYDLYILSEVPAENGQFVAATLAGGDGRIYLVGSAQEFEQDRTHIEATQALEACRVLTPDISIARRWGIDLTEVDRAVAACRQAAEAGQSREAQAQAKQATEALRAAIDGDSLLRMTRKALDEMSVELAELSRIAEHHSTTPRWWTGSDHPMMIPNPDFLDLSKEYWRVGRAYRDLYMRYLAAEKEGLWTGVNQTRLDLLVVRDGLLGCLRGRLTPAHEPEAE